MDTTQTSGLKQGLYASLKINHKHLHGHYEEVGFALASCG